MKLHAIVFWGAKLYSELLKCSIILKAESCHDVVNGCDGKCGRTPLLKACLMNRMDIIETLQSELLAGTFQN